MEQSSNISTHEVRQSLYLRKRKERKGSPRDTALRVLEKLQQTKDGLMHNSRMEIVESGSGNSGTKVRKW